MKRRSSPPARSASSAAAAKPTEFIETAHALKTNRWLLPSAVMLWGVLLAVWLVRPFFTLPVEQSYANHESYSYQMRLIEFHDCLTHGYWSPQWCSHIRGGLGGPLFGYYQPGFFYAASLPATFMHPTYALGATVFVFALLGYWGAYRTVSLRWGALSGWLAGTALLLSPYTATNILIRGDLSEFAAMMLVPVALAGLLGWLDDRRVRWLLVLALAGAGIVTTHPAVALVAYPVLATSALALPRRDWLFSVSTAGAALLAGIGLSAFYWAPVFFEWDYISGAKAFAGAHHFSKSFVPVAEFFTTYRGHESVKMPLTFGAAIMALLAINLVAVVVNWHRLDAAAWRWFALFMGLGLVTTCLMTSSSQFVWQGSEMLGRLQFPWRLFSITTTALVCVGAAWPAWPWPQVRVGAAFVMALALVVAGFGYLRVPPGVTVWQPKKPTDLETVYYAPDAANEWVPSGAAVILATGREQPNKVGQGDITNFRRDQCYLTAEVNAPGPMGILLPHYYFPVGWRATLNGEPVELSANHTKGLMQIRLPAGGSGLLEVRFHMTPWRKRGWYFTTLTAIGLVSAIMAVRVARSRATSGPSLGH